ILLVSALAVMPALAAPEGKGAAENKLPAEVQAILDKADKFELLSLDPTPEEQEPKDAFHGYKVLGRTALKDADVRKKIVAALNSASMPDRRQLLQFVGLGAAASLTQAAVAGPFTADEAEQLVPADKKLSPAWVRSLTARGEPTVWRGADTALIGMPVGGL